MCVVISDAQPTPASLTDEYSKVRGEATQFVENPDYRLYFARSFPPPLKELREGTARGKRACPP